MSIRAYQQTARRTENPREVEYRLFAQVTSALTEAAETGKSDRELNSSTSYPPGWLPRPRRAAPMNVTRTQREPPPLSTHLQAPAISAYI